MRALAIATLFLCVSLPARAADVSVEAVGGYTSFGSASQSLEAVFGSSRLSSLGGGAAVVVKERFGLSVRARWFETTGERVFVAGPSDPVFSLGHPVRLEGRPIAISLSYRFRPDRFVTPYAGIGIEALRTLETSTVAGETTRLENTQTGPLALAGVEVGPGKLRLGLEVQYARHPDAIGLGGVSEVFGEDDLGGITVLARLILIPTR